MRIMIKGGVWKNTEDEILKAAVMKYGLNQWSRISSLLVRKSAKQCKARWYEWLDPAIKKTEWTRDEDEKLLHLAKLMPCQWRTIAPIVGRTPAQCLERYEKLLDMAVSKEDQYDRRDDPRRLRPGEIDPNPESKPARPDPVDMDEDEKEMLSEARARLANTRGKKAKRKAREKQLEEARRLAMLQKKRELKAAGIELRGRGKPRGVDYTNEVAFERKPAPGFFDTGDEDKVAHEIAQEFRPITVEEMEGKRRRDLEDHLVKQDIKRSKLKEALDLPSAVAKAQELNDPALLRRRTKMMLPAPQISEAELEQIARMTADGGAIYEAEDGAGGDATRQLLGTYGPTPSRLATPARTPRTESGVDRIMVEAQNLSRMQNLATPLVGGESVDLRALGSDFGGVTPAARAAATPHPLAGAATPGQHQPATPAGGTSVRRGSIAIAGVPSTPSGFGTSATPSRGSATGGFGATPRQTPIRDELGLNDADSMVPSDSSRIQKQRGSLLRSELRAGLGALPAPLNEYQIMAPDTVPAEQEEGEEAIEEDAADIRARKLKQEEEKRVEEEKRKSQALQRHLPRPLSLDEFLRTLRLDAASSRPAGWVHGERNLPIVLDNRLERAEDLVQRELALLLQYEAAKYPVKDALQKDKKGSKGDKKAAVTTVAVPEIERFELPELQAAAALVEAERVALLPVVGSELPLHEYAEAAENARKDFIWIPSKHQWGRAAGATHTMRIDSLRAEYEAALAEMQRQAKHAARMEQKTTLLTSGLQARDNKLRGQVDELFSSLQAAVVDLHCFEALHERELRAGPERIEAMQTLVSAQLARESDLQERFKQLNRQRSDLLEALQQPA